MIFTIPWLLPVVVKLKKTGDISVISYSLLLVPIPNNVFKSSIFVVPVPPFSTLNVPITSLKLKSEPSTWYLEPSEMLILPTTSIVVMGNVLPIPTLPSLDKVILLVDNNDITSVSL